jgi:hypothetical protein
MSKRSFRDKPDGAPHYPTLETHDRSRRRWLGWVGAVLLGASGMTGCLGKDTAGVAPYPPALKDLGTDARLDGRGDGYPRGRDQQAAIDQVPGQEREADAKQRIR